MDAFALAIVGAGGAPRAIPGLAGHEPNEEEARAGAAAASTAMAELRKVAPRAALVRLGDRLFRTQLAGICPGETITPRLLAIKEKFDPDGLFFLHHGVGSEAWSADGFERVR